MWLIILIDKIFLVLFFKKEHLSLLFVNKKKQKNFNTLPGRL